MPKSTSFHHLLVQPSKDGMCSCYDMHGKWSRCWSFLWVSCEAVMNLTVPRLQV